MCLITEYFKRSPLPHRVFSQSPIPARPINPLVAFASGSSAGVAGGHGRFQDCKQHARVRFVVSPPSTLGRHRRTQCDPPGLRNPDFFLSSSVMPRVATTQPYPTTPKPATKGHIFLAWPAAKVIMLWFWNGIAFKSVLRTETGGSVVTGRL
jgi:hypothetical protein